MRILFVISSLNAGGAQRILSNIVCNLPEDKYDIDILLNDANNIAYPYRGRLLNLGVKDPKNENRNSIIYQLKVLIKRYRKLKKLKKSREYAICISFMESANIVNILTGKKHCKTILTVNEYLPNSELITLKLIDRMSKYYYNSADRVIAVSKGIGQHLVETRRFPSNLITVVRNSININEIKAKAGTQRSQKHQENRPFTFITVGRLSYQKGQWHLIRAFAEFRKKHRQEHSGCRLIILGSGPLFNYFQKMIGIYGLDDSVILKGFVNNPFKELINADVFVFPSLYEGLGLALLEAMACGLPVISSDYRSGAREILAPSTDLSFEQTAENELAEFGMLTPVCSGKRHFSKGSLEPQEQLLLEAMELMYADETIRRSYCEASKKRVLDFSIEKFVEQWINVIEDVCQENCQTVTKL